MTAQAIDLILSASYDTRRDDLRISVDPAQFEDNGSPLDAPDLEGIGEPVFIGRNGALSLTLSLFSVDATPTQPGTLDVAIETAASRQAHRWRPLGKFTTQTAIGTAALALAGADAFVRARYKLSAGAAFSFSVAGTAQLIMLASAAQSASGVGSAVDMAQYRSALQGIDVTAVSGTLTLTVETADNQAAPDASWLTVATPDAISAPASVEVVVPNLARYARVRWALSIGGSATFGVSGVSRLTLATPSDRARLGNRRGLFPELSDEDADTWLVSATATVLGTVGGRFEHPPRAWQDDMREACIAIADWRALGYGRGTEPGKDIDPKQLVAYERYCHYEGNPQLPGNVGWLRLVAERKEHPLQFLDSSTPARDGETRRLAVASTPLRGWGGPQARQRGEWEP